jgi:hypothetical protein
LAASALSYTQVRLRANKNIEKMKRIESEEKRRRRKEKGRRRE